jgi:hypothetical protein
MADKENEKKGDDTESLGELKKERDKIESKYHSTLAELEDMKRRMTKFESLDVEKLKADAEALRLLQEKDASGDPEKMKKLVKDREAEIRASVEQDIQKLKKSLEELTNRNKELEVTERVFALASARFNEDTYEDVKEKIRRHCNLADGGISVTIDGKPAYEPGSASKPMSPESFVNWLVEQRPSWAKPTNKGGTRTEGAKNTNGAAAGKSYSLSQLQNMDSAEQRKAAAEMPAEDRAKILNQLITS